MEKSITVIISALNEADHIQAAVEAARDVFGQMAASYELIIFNDGSTDATGKIADQLAQQFCNIRVVHHEANQGLAEIARAGIQMAKKNYITWFPADNSIQAKSLIPVLSKIGQHDLIIAYMKNNHQRRFLRKIISKTFAGSVNTLFNLKIRYYNGPSVYPTSVLKLMQIKSGGHAFFAEMLVRCLKMNHSFIEVPFEHTPATDQRSKSLTIKNVLEVMRTFYVLGKDIYVFKQPLG